MYVKDLASNGVRPTESSLASNIVQLKALARNRRVAELILRNASNPAQIDLDVLVRDLEKLRIAGSVGIKASFRTAKEVAEAAERVEWVVRGYLALGANTELTGKAKMAGKTTLIACMVSCILDGTPCLGDRARKAPVVFLTEQTTSTFREVLRRAGLLHRDDLSILSYWDVKGLTWPTIVEMAGQKADRIGADVIVVDTLAQFAGIKGDGENNSGDASDALAPLQQQAHPGGKRCSSRGTPARAARQGWRGRPRVHCLYWRRGHRA